MVQNPREAYQVLYKLPFSYGSIGASCLKSPSVSHNASIFSECYDYVQPQPWVINLGTECSYFLRAKVYQLVVTKAANNQFPKWLRFQQIVFSLGIGIGPIFNYTCTLLSCDWQWVYSRLTTQATMFREQSRPPCDRSQQKSRGPNIILVLTAVENSNNNWVSSLLAWEGFLSKQRIFGELVYSWVLVSSQGNRTIQGTYLKVSIILRSCMNKIRILENKVKPDGRQLFEAAKVMFMPGRGILNLSDHTSQTPVDYQYLKNHDGYIGSVVFNLQEFTNNSEVMINFQLTCCKGIVVEAKGNYKQAFQEIKKALVEKDHLLDFVYLPLSPSPESDAQVQQVARLALLFQSIGKIPVIGLQMVSISIIDFQKMLSDLTYHISMENLFLDALMIEVELIKPQIKQKSQLINMTILRRCLPAGLHKIAIRVNQDIKKKQLFDMAKLKNIQKSEIFYSIQGYKENPYEWAMASAGIFV